MTNFSNNTVGINGENIALIYYQNLGWETVTKNFQYYQKGRSGRRAEIDIILKKDNVLLIVEVKTRRTQSFGIAINSITTSKLSNIKSGLSYFLIKNQIYKNFFIKLDIFCIDSGKISIYPIQSM